MATRWPSAGFRAAFMATKMIYGDGGCARQQRHRSNAFLLAFPFALPENALLFLPPTFLPFFFFLTFPFPSLCPSLLLSSLPVFPFSFLLNRFPFRTLFIRLFRLSFFCLLSLSSSLLHISL